MLEKEIMAYSLQNAIEFGKANPGKIIGKLFQYGLDKKDIEKVKPIIKEAIEKVNSIPEKERIIAFEKFKDVIKEKVQEDKGLPSLIGSERNGKMTFRLAPFPSGALHVGNAKTFLLNSLYSEDYKARTILVMDDTIGSENKQPDKESYRLIKDAFKWLGIKYDKIYYKSDRLKIYYKYAEKLIKKGKAYVCYCTQEKLRENRAKGIACGCREFPIGIQIARWKEMFEMEEKHAVLRIKTSMTHKNPAFRDRVLFKISDRKHPRVGNKYRIWPTLEMSWAIDDYLLKVTHILRGNDLMMETEMEKYIWDIFKWKHPEVIHTGMVLIDGIQLSKSKSQKEVKSGKYFGWDDPRTWSIQSLARRGILSKSIKEFVKEIGLNKHDITVPIENLYSINRKFLDADSNRYSFVSNPVKIKFENNPGVKDMDIPIHPDKTETRNIKVGNHVFVFSEDFEKLKGKEIRLLHLFNVNLDLDAKITSIGNKKIPRINWVSSGVKTKILMPDGKWVEGLAEEGINKLKVGEIIQFERFGFVRFDKKNNGIKEFWFAHK